MVKIIRREKDDMSSSNVYINCSKVYKYPDKNDCYSPSVKYAEYKYEIAKQPNRIYDMVRECFFNLGYDKEHYNTKEWNPLGFLIHKNDTVILKPNMVMHENLVIENGLDCIITHPSIVRAILDYVIIALNGSGKIIIGDAPVQTCDFQKLIKKAGYDLIIDFYRAKNINIDLIDFRNYISEKKKNGLLIKKESKANESVIVDLKSDSSFSGILKEQYEKLRITDYDPSIMMDHHNEKKNEYLIAKSILEADVIINMPKPKTHRKAGVTISLKNMVGINTNKEWLPHHTVGSVANNGDEYEKNSIRKATIAKILDKKNYYIAHKKMVRARICHILRRGLSLSLKMFVTRDNFSEGSWYGNNTIWRTIFDLNKIIYFADKKGIMRNKPQRRIFVVGDMIISGEGDGPLKASPKNVGIIAMSESPTNFDKVICTIMGFNYERIPSIYNAVNYTGKYSFSSKTEAIILSNNKKWKNKNFFDIKKEDTLNFKLSSGWKNILKDR
jgi:uncharacterized protein (DUF362 family)